MSLRRAGALGLALVMGSAWEHARAQESSLPAAPSAPAISAAQDVAVVYAGTIRGGVKAGAIALPGVAVTATNTLTGKKYATATDVNGVYAMTIPKTGRYVVRVELAAFASVTKEVRLTAEAAAGTAEFGMELASRVTARERQQAGAGAGLPAGLANVLGRGMQSLNLQGGDAGASDASAGGGNAGASLPSLGGLGGEATDSVAVSGQVGQTNGLANLNEDDVRQRIQDALAQARQQGGAVGDQANALAGVLGSFLGPGGFGGGGGGRGGRGGGGFGGGRGFNPTETHGAVFYTGSNGVLNAAPFSVSGVPVANPANSQNTFGLVLSGSPYLPGLTKPNPKQFVFLNVTGGRNINPLIFNATVPTVAERSGDFSGLVQNVTTASGVSAAQLVPVYDPGTGAPFGCPPAPAACGPGQATNVIPANRISAQALALLNYYPAPNVGVPPIGGYNYQTLTTAGANSTNASARYVRNFGQQPAFGGGGGRRGGNTNGPPALRQNINLNGSYSHAANDQRNIFLPLGGANVTDGYGLTAGYTVGYGRFTNNASVNWNRSRTAARNFFTGANFGPGGIGDGFGGNPASGTLLGNGFYGVPNLTFAGFDGLGQAVPSNNVNQTISFSDFVSWNHKKHNMRFGGDVRRVHADSIGGTNLFGSYTFTGYATQAPGSAASASGTQQPPSGSGFADFLLGLPQQTTIQAGLAKTYLRANVFDWYVQDDWRARGGLTLNYGLRYEFFGPYSEKNGRLVNLDHNANFTQVAAVLPGQVGSLSGGYPAALVNGDHALYSPRFGFAWRPKLLPKLTKEAVVRGGYGINYNTGQYAGFARQLAFQPPFAVTQTNTVGQQGCTPGNLTLAQGFGCSASTTQNNYAVNRNYRLGHVQVWNLGVQRTFPLGIVANVDYNGSKGGDLDVVRAPNRTATGLLDAGIQPFNYEDSQAFSRLNAVAVNLRKRMQKGVSLQGTYTYGHSIDNASTIGGTTVVVAQNDLDLNAEEGNSSFLRRQSLNGNWVIELPFGEGRALLAKNGRWSRALEGFNVSGNFSFASGPYFTPIYVATVTEVATGAAASRRPNRNFAAPVKGAGSLRSFFNTAAFTDPGTGYGTASRGSIEGPGTVAVNSALSRTFSFGETRSFEARMTAANVFNTVQYQNLNTTLNSPTFGQVTGAAARRSLQFTGRYRF